MLRYIRYRPEEAPYRVINSQTHEYGTFFFLHGIDHDDARYLGAEVELYIGPEKEKHTINTTALIWIPANTVHGPFIPQTSNSTSVSAFIINHQTRKVDIINLCNLNKISL